MLNKEVIKALSKKCVQGWGSDRGHNEYTERYTYIAKDEKSSIYKIGRTVNLRDRIGAIYSSIYFKGLNYQLIAFTPCDIEESVQLAIIEAGGIPPVRRSRVGVIPKEMFTLTDEDVDLIIQEFRFHRSVDGMIPIIERCEDGEYKSIFCNYNVLSWEKPIQHRIKVEEKQDGVQ